MEDDQPYDVVLDDELQWSCVPRASAPDDEMAAATEEKRHQRFIDTWTEKGGIPPRGPYNQEEEEAAAADDDDIGAHFVTTDRHLANANRDIGRLLDNACAVVTAAGLPHPPDMATGYRLVLLDRARRIAMGTARPPPMSLTQGLDGGVNRTPSRRRRPRPRPSSQQDVMSRKGGRRADMLPRRRGDTGRTVCVGVRPNQFDWRHGSGSRHAAARPRLRVAPKKHDIIGIEPLRRNRTHRLQRVLAGYLLRQPAASATRAAVRHL